MSKELLRILIDQITVAVVGSSELVNVTIWWAGVHQTSGQAVRTVGCLRQLSYFPPMLALITDLAAAGQTTRQIADRLNAEGFRPPKRTSRYTPQQVLHLVNQHGIRIQPRCGRPAALTDLPAGQWTLADLATVLRMPAASIYNWIYHGWGTAHRTDDNRFWIITADDAEIERLRELRNRPPGYYTRKRCTDAHPQPTEQEGPRP